MDCFGNTLETGKLGTDIREGKFSWTFVTAINKASKEQRMQLFELYGKEEYENNIRKLYTELEIDKDYEQLAKNKQRELSILLSNKHIQNNPIEKIFEYLSNIIFNRRK